MEPAFKIGFWKVYLSENAVMRLTVLDWDGPSPAAIFPTRILKEGRHGRAGMEKEEGKKEATVVLRGKIGPQQGTLESARADQGKVLPEYVDGVQPPTL